MIPVPSALQRLADEIDGWLDLRCPERALDLLGPLLGDPEGRAAGLTMRVRAYVRQGRYADALIDINELKQAYPDLEWVELTEAWCRKRTGDLSGAVRCMERLLRRHPRSGIAHFNLGCYLALSGQVERAIDELSVACGIDEQFRTLARDEQDLDGLRTDARFRQLVRAAAAADAAAGDDDVDDDDGSDGDDDGPSPEHN